MGLLRKTKEREPPPLEEWPKGTVELDVRSFREFVDRYPLVAVEFWASWCAPCKTMRPIVRDLAERYRGTIAIGKVNTGIHPNIARDLDVMTVPYIVFFSYGKRVDELRGKMSKRRLEGWFKNLAGKFGP